MNPFSQFLTQKVSNRKFLQFVHRWDLVEQIIISTYRQQGILAQDSKAWRKIRYEARKDYALWEEKLIPLWRQTLVNGEPVIEDPFLWLLNFENVEEFQHNWRAMQTLPASREAINRFLLSLKVERQ